MAEGGFDIDAMSSGNVPQYWSQACLVAKNPFVAARFFNLYMKAFVTHLLGYDEVSGENLESFMGGPRQGVLGFTKAYYGCVEAQGRGTLHCHMVVWIEGALNPNELKARLINAADNSFCATVVTSIVGAFQRSDYFLRWLIRRLTNSLRHIFARFLTQF